MWVCEMRAFITSTVTVTVVACLAFMLLNPILFSEIHSDFTGDEVFLPENGRYDFNLFSLRTTNCSNFTAKIVKVGHTKLVGGDSYSINVLEYDNMLDFEVRGFQKEIEAEMKSPYRIVDGVKVYEANFILFKRYGSYVQKDDLELFITSGSPNETAYMVNSLKIV